MINPVKSFLTHGPLTNGPLICFCVTVLFCDREEPGTRAIIDCKTVRIFAYSSTREQSNKRSGTLYRFLY